MAVMGPYTEPAGASGLSERDRSHWAPHLTERAVSAFTPQNLTNYGDGNPYRIHRPRPSRKLVPFGSEIWSTHQFGKECCSRHNHRRAAMAGNARCRQGEGHRPTAYLACANLISITRVYTRSARDHRPMLAITRRRAAVGPCTPPSVTSLWR